MKKTGMLLLCLIMALNLVCIPQNAELPSEPETVETAQPAEQPTAQPVDTVEIEQPVETSAAQTSQPVLIRQFDVGDILGEEQTAATLISYDLDGDGAEETIGFSLDWDGECTTVTDGSRSFVFAESPMLRSVFLLDMDPASPYGNLLVVVDTGSDDYVTIALHPEGDRLVKDAEILGYPYWSEDQGVVMEERTGLLGSNMGERSYHGDAFVPDSEWIECWVPSEESLLEDPQDLIDGGVLLHLVRDLPIESDGESRMIWAGTHIYMVRFHASNTMAVVSQMDGGVVGVVHFAYNPDTYTYTIDGINQDDYFDNIFYAD